MSRANTLRPRGSPAHGNIEEAISTQLTERECTILDKGVTAYRKRGDIIMLVQSLSTVLNTNKKRQLLVPIRDAYVKPTDRIKFNNLAVKYGIAVTRDGTKKREKTLERERKVSGTRKIDVKRDRVGEWGFSVRGGSEHGIGIFVSWVDPGSQAQKAGLQSGDQILKVNETNFEGISHYEATQTLRGCRKARLWLKLQGKFPGMQYATKSYRWVNAEGQPASPPPERMMTPDTDSLRANSKVRLDPDERKVSIMVSEGKELGISIRGGAEHGLGIYISRVDDGSVADDYGLKSGDQILEVNSVSFISILHSEAAKALRTQRLMVVKVKDVGKIPHSRVTAIGQTEWHSSPQNSMTLPSKTSSRAVSQELLNQRHTSPRTPVFAQGAGTQVMLTKSSSPARGIMNEVARSLLTVQELSTFKYYITEYEQNRVSVEDLAHALLQMLNTKEKIQLITEVRNIIRGEDLEQFNEMTIQKEIEARMQNRHPMLHGSSQLSMSSDDGGIQARGIGSYTINTQETNLLDEQLPEFTQQAGDGPMLLAVRRTKEEDEDSLDRIPQRIAPSIPKFHVPPPPSSIPPVSSTPNQDLMADTMKDRRRKIHPNSMDSQLLLESAWEESNTSSMIDEDTLQRRLKETEERLKAEYEEMQQKLLEEQAKKIEEEQRQLFEAEKAELEYQIQNQSKEKMEEEIWQQAEEHMREELKAEISKETEERLRDEFERELQKKMAENLKRRDSDVRRKNVSRLEEEEQLRIEIEEQVKTETEEQVRIEYEERLQRESEEKARLAEEVKSYRSIRESLEQEKKQRQQLEQARREAEERARREAEEKEKLEELLREAKEQAEEERRQAEENEHLLRQREERLREEEEERRRMEEQRRMKEEEEEARRREEEKRQRKEEKRRREEEKRQREEEEQRREEEERQREEEERRREEEEEARRREEEEEFRQREEEELRRRQEEELRQQEEREEEEMRLREEEEMRLRKEEQQREREEQKRRQKEKERQKKERERKNAATAAFDPLAMDNLIMQSGSVSGGTAPAATAAVVPRRTNPSNGSGQSRRQQIEEERRKAEQMLMRQMMRSKPGAATPTEETDGQSHGGYTGLKGKIQTVTVTKVSRKLGIAVEGGATTKNQKGVVIRQITPDGSAALTGQDLMVGQQILTVGGKSLKGLKHKDAVITIKNAFDGPMNKKIEFVVLEHEEQE